MRCKQFYNNTDKEYEFVNDSDLIMGIYDQLALEDDEAYELASVICKEVLATTNNLHAYDLIY